MVFFPFAKLCHSVQYVIQTIPVNNKQNCQQLLIICSLIHFRLFSETTSFRSPKNTCSSLVIYFIFYHYRHGTTHDFVLQYGSQMGQRIADWHKTQDQHSLFYLHVNLHTVILQLCKTALFNAVHLNICFNSLCELRVTEQDIFAVD